MDIRDGNLITPKGASLIFGKEIEPEKKISLKEENTETYLPYTIIITEDSDENNNILASEIDFNNEQTDLLSTNVQQAIEEIESNINELTAREFVEYNSENSFQIASEAIKTGKSLWIQIKANEITPSMTTDNTICAPLDCYNLSADGETINYCDFKVSHGGYNKIARLNIYGWELSDDSNGGSNVVIYRWEEEN